LLFALVVLVRSLSARNAYEIALSVIVLCILLALYITGAWACRRFAALEPGWKPPAPMGANAPGETLITGLDVPLPWFFRLHFIVRGRFFPAGDRSGCPVQAETSAPWRSGPALLTMRFPMSGFFQGTGACRLRDILGFFSFPCGLVLPRTFSIQGSPCSGKPFRLEAFSGAEDQRNRTSNDEERYYMREYAPGDRFRDINWKSSDRINTLITRISPDNQEKVSRIEVNFRNYRSARRVTGGKVVENQVSLEELWLLDRAKARLALFLRTVKEEQAAYVFHVSAAQKSWAINDQDELDQFLEELAALPFAPPQNNAEAAEALSQGELYIFSTACDAGLPAFLLTRQLAPSYVFLVRPPAPGKSTGEIDKLYVRDFMLNGFVPLPHWLVFSGKRRAVYVPPVPCLIDYAEAAW
jgi:hypothetical protein